MFTVLAIVSLATTAVVAQSATSTASPLIPTGISSDCSSFLTSLNTNTALTSCTSALTSATSAYGPGSNATNPTASSISSTLNTICSSSTTSACSDSLIRSTLADFSSKCTVELTSSLNKDVLTIYDIFYAITPMRAALCSKDDSGSYCVTQAAANVANSTSTSASSLTNAAVSKGTVDLAEIQKYLATNEGVQRRAESVALSPNTTTIGKSNLLFLFLQPTTSSAVLCTSCTRNVILAYLDFKGDVPYAPGISSSTILYGLLDLYNGVVSQCGTNFLSGAVQAAGSLSGGSIGSSSAAPRTFGDFKTAVAVALGIASLVLVSLN